MAIDIQDAVIKQLATYFNAALPVGDARFVKAAVEGWPEWEEGITEVSSSFVSITPMSASVSLHAPIASAVVDDPDDPGNPAKALVTYRMGDANLEVMLDLWSPYKVRLAELAHVVDCNLHNDLPYSTGLILDVADYYGARLSVYDIESITLKSTSETSAAGAHRKTWVLKCHIDVLCQATSPRQAEILLTGSTTLAGATLTEALLTIS